MTSCYCFGCSRPTDVWVCTVLSLSREGRIETVRRNQPEVVTTEYSVTDSLNRYKWDKNLKLFKSQSRETLYYIYKASYLRSSGL